MSDTQKKQGRLASLDTLRGFDMFWIMGGDGLSLALAAATGWPILRWWAVQVEHVEWHGFHFYDMVFPLFLFVAGISFPFSVRHRMNDRKALVLHILRRGLTLVVLGIIYNNAIRFNFSEMRFPSVLGRIGLAWMFAGLIWIYIKPKWRIPVVAGILLIYWALLDFFHLPGHDAYSMEGSLAGVVDRAVMPGRLYLGMHDPEGLLGVIPAIATALMGMFTGKAVLLTERQQFGRLALLLATTGILLFAAGWLWNFLMPVNKNLWTSSFVLVAGGMSMLLFAAFFWIIDVRGWQKWSFPFRIIGMNAIAIYMGQRIFDLGKTADFLFGGVTALASAQWKPVMDASFYALTCWIILYFLYRYKIFIKV